MLLDSIIFLENLGCYEKEIYKVLGEIVEEIMIKNFLIIRL